MLFGPGEDGVLGGDVDDVAAQPWAIITRAASRETRKEPRAMMSCWRSQSLAVVSSSGLEMEIPALLTTRSTPPKASAAVVKAAAICSSEVTSAVDGDGLVRAAQLRAATAAAVSAFEVGDDDAGALGDQAVRDGLADARSPRR